jgi:hypothetical protein
MPSGGSNLLMVLVGGATVVWGAKRRIVMRNTEDCLRDVTAWLESQGRISVVREVARRCLIDPESPEGACARRAEEDRGQADGHSWPKLPPEVFYG